MKVLLSCNLDKVALLRNARDGNIPSLIGAATACIEAGADGLTLHPRADRRHALFQDLRDFKKITTDYSLSSGRRIELNLEGDLRPDLLDLVQEVQPDQFTVVPVDQGEKTSERGWQLHDPQEQLRNTIVTMQGTTRVSVFVDAEIDSINLAAAAGAKSVEFYTGAYANAFGSAIGPDSPSTELLNREMARLLAATRHARSLGLRVNAGHGLNLTNLSPLVKLIQPEELSIGHALIADSLWYGLSETVKKYQTAIGAGLER